MGEAQSLNRTTDLGRKLFYASFVLMLLRTIVASSAFSVYLDTQSFFYRYVLRIAFWLPILLKFLTQDNFSGRSFLRYTLFVLAIVIALFFNRSYTLMDIAVLTVGVHGVPLRSAVRAYFYTAAISCAALFVMSLVGIVENYVTYTDTRPRYAFGSTYATDFAATLFYLELAHAYLKGKKYNYWNFFFWIAVSLFVLHFCVARLDFAMIFCFAWMMMFVTYIPKFFSHRSVQVILWAAIPVFCIAAIAIHLVYTPQNHFLFQLNELLSGRLYYGKMIFDDYGFSLFGHKIKMQGWGFTTETWDPELGYYFVDSGWLSMTFQYGLAMLVFVCTVFTVVSRRNLKQGNYVLPVILFFLALTSIIDHHILEFWFDPFILVLNAGLCSEKRHVPAAVKTALPERA